MKRSKMIDMLYTEARKLNLREIESLLSLVESYMPDKQHIKKIIEIRDPENIIGFISRHTTYSHEYKWEKEEDLEDEKK